MSPARSRPHLAGGPDRVVLLGAKLHKLAIACLLLLFPRQEAFSQTADPPADAASGTPAGTSKITKAIFDYLAMTGTNRTANFKPLTQRERNTAYLESLINPVLYFKAGLSGALDLRSNKPEEWEQGASGYGKRFGNILAQYGIQRTVTYGLSSALHEDNRYFGSAKKGVWRRTGSALAGSFLARHDNGKQYPSVSLIGGFAAASFISRSWQPPSTQSAGDGAVSFGLSMGYNALATVAKEFLPDLVRPLVKRRQPARPGPANSGPAPPVKKD